MARLIDLPEWERQRHLDKIRELPDFGSTPFVAGPPLNRRRVAIVTTSGLHVSGDRPFATESADYRVIPGAAPASSLRMSHTSVNFDRSGFQEDVNVVFPLERLREIEADGGIGAISGFHYSFMGAAPIRALEPKARELTGLLKRDRVDAVLLTPVWPNCTCAVGALGHYIEREGVPTAQISLIREQTAAIRPPRALWVPFMLGRPFGAPHEPDFQRRVLRALLSLFERASGPVLEDFPEDAPATDAREEEFACPVSFAATDVKDSDLAEAMRGEIAQLAPWYDLAVRRRGRTTVGVSGMRVEDAASHAACYIDGAARPPAIPGLSAGVTLKRACDDVKAYYYEAAGAQPGNLSPGAIDSWFWRETAAAKVFLAIQQVCLKSSDESLQPLGKLSLIPRAASHLLAVSQNTRDRGVREIWMSLQEKLDAHKAKSGANRPPEVRAALQRGTDELRASGILERVLKVGARAPEFALPNQDGATVRSAALLERGPLVLTFYRGHWWPYCNLELEALETVAAEVRALGATLIAVSPQRAEFLRQMIAKHKLSFDVLTDSGNEVAAKFGLKFTVSDEVKKVYQGLFKVDLEKFNADGSWTLPMPARFIIDRRGIVRYAEADPDYTKRPEPGDTVAALRAVAR